MISLFPLPICDAPGILAAQISVAKDFDVTVGVTLSWLSIISGYYTHSTSGMEEIQEKGYETKRQAYE